jgi:predicted ribosome quality control (RQC) complex YloA/Tae2 family protein
LTEIGKDRDDRVVRLKFGIVDELGESVVRQLIVQLTGKAANVLLLDVSGRITDALRPPRGENQTPGENYQPPPSQPNERIDAGLKLSGDSPSLAADEYFQKVDKERAFSDRAGRLRAQLNSEIKRREKLRLNLHQDLLDHGDPERHKRIGDLLLANVSTARRAGPNVEITDYYTEGAPTIELEIDESITLQEEAARLFRQYTKAKRAKEEISQRLGELDNELKPLHAKLSMLAQIIADHDEMALSNFDDTKGQRRSQKSESKTQNKVPGVRQYVSSDGYEIWVGRAARDNDNLTFRLAKPNDLWLHAGDYPGSHVIVRNPGRKEIPQRTVIEAAQLAGYFSQARDDSKVVVHYSERKFLSKPRGAAPGLVRMSRFRSITVEPKVPSTT